MSAPTAEVSAAKTVADESASLKISPASKPDTDLEDAEPPVVPPEDTSKEDGGVTEGVAGVLFGGGEARHEKEQPQDKEEPTKETPAAASEDSTPAPKSGSDSKDTVAKEAGSESSSDQSEHDKDKDGGFAVRIAEKLGLMPSEEKEDETAAAAATDTHAGPTEETPAAAAGEVATPRAKSDSSSDSGSSSGRSEQDKDNDKNNRGFVGMIAETLGLMPSEEKEDKETAAPAPAADASANAGAAT